MKIKQWVLAMVPHMTAALRYADIDVVSDIDVGGGTIPFSRWLNGWLANTALGFVEEEGVLPLPSTSVAMSLTHSCQSDMDPEWGSELAIAAGLRALGPEWDIDWVARRY